MITACCPIRWRAWACLVTLLAWWPGVEAALYCVDSAETMRQAINGAKASPGADEIRMKSGIYGPPIVSGPDAQYDLTLASGNDLTISGGWSGANCTAQTNDAALTLMDGNQQDRIFDIGVSGGSFGVTIRISNLMLFQGRDVGNVGGCMRIQGYQGVGANVYLERLIFAECTAGQRGGALAVITQSGHLQIKGNRFVFNTANSESAAYLNNVSGNTYFINNSVIGNTTLSPVWPALTTACNLIDYCLVANNVFWNNVDANGANRDASLVGGQSLHNNRLDAYSGVPTSAANNISADPGYHSFNDFDVHADSPLRNAGRSDFPFVSPPSLDLKGVARPGGAAIDIGAQEFNEPEGPLFANQFE
ncbi:choice-of-anchor Q domain-containing protein [Ahniella affigens]|uniref:choice-of-anchor Q domain-containing protein n=1 Tax=Ahniella affigens TaxID=2021234 RepID=UPI0011B278F2|nr:choice-of-anchor Q domain-containing protein [Ahniella affigens]